MEGSEGQSWVSPARSEEIWRKVHVKLALDDLQDMTYYSNSVPSNDVNDIRGAGWHGVFEAS